MLIAIMSYSIDTARLNVARLMENNPTNGQIVYQNSVLSIKESIMEKLVNQ